MEAATQTEQAPNVTFLSRSEDQFIAVEKEHRSKLTGEKIEQRFFPRFVEGRLTTDMLREQAKAADCEDVERSVTDAIAFIRDLPNFNVSATNGIWEEDHAPDEPQPSIKEQNAVLAKAAARSDRDAVQAVLNDERDTHNRSVVTDLAERILDAMEDSE